MPIVIKRPFFGPIHFQIDGHDSGTESDGEINQRDNDMELSNYLNASYIKYQLYIFMFARIIMTNSGVMGGFEWKINP